jgi:FixJ family two-component response regulator
MQRLQTVMTPQRAPAAFAQRVGRDFPYHERHTSAVTKNSGASAQVASETLTKGVDSSLLLQSLRTPCNEIESPGAQPRFTEMIVHFVVNDPASAKTLAEFLMSKGMSVVTFKTAAEYLAAARDDRPACLILDLILPDGSGLELQSRLASDGAPPVIFVTSYRDPISVVRAMKNGAIDFMLEPVDFGQLMAAVELAFAEDLAKRNERNECTSLLTRWQSLTPRETEVFHHTVAGLLNKQAAAELGVAENTYQVHRGRVMRKMQANSLADLVRMSTKLESILPKPCRKRTCYGVTVAVPTRIDKYAHHSESNPSTYGERSVEARGYAAGLGGL